MSEGKALLNEGLHLKKTFKSERSKSKRRDIARKALRLKIQCQQALIMPGMENCLEGAADRFRYYAAMDAAESILLNI